MHLNWHGLVRVKFFYLVLEVLGDLHLLRLWVKTDQDQINLVFNTHLRNCE